MKNGIIALLSGNCRAARRHNPPSGLETLSRTALSLFLALVLAALLLEIQGKSGPQGILAILEGGFGNPASLTLAARADGLRGIPAFFKGCFYDNYALADSLLKSMPIFLCSLGLSACFYLKLWNIGAEGQYVMGAVGSTAAVLAFPDAPAWALLPAMFLAGTCAGALWAFLPAVLRERFRTNEIITTLMLNYIAILLLQYLVAGPWKDPCGQGFIMTREFPAAAVLPTLAGRAHLGLLFCIAVAWAWHLFMRQTRYGFEMLAYGANPRAAGYAGMRCSLMVVAVMTLCGALAGLAGLCEISVQARLWPNSAAGYGYTAIVVAWLARLRVGGIAFFSLLLAAFRVGVENLQLEMGVAAAFGDLLQGSILLMVLAGRFFDSYTLRVPQSDPALPGTEDAP